MLAIVFLVTMIFLRGAWRRIRQHRDMNVHAFWTGGYDDECRWYGKLMEAYQAPTVPLLSTLLTLTFGVFAIAVKLSIAARMAEFRPQHAERDVTADALEVPGPGRDE